MFEPIAYVKNEVKEPMDLHWGRVVSEIVLDEELSAGLTGLWEFSHVIVVYHLHKAKFVREKHLLRRPQGRADMPEVGLFSQRVKDRPNPIGITAAKILSVQGNILRVQGLDAVNETPVLDIKPYFPHYDQKEDAIVPEWVQVLMKDYF